MNIPGPLPASAASLPASAPKDPQLMALANRLEAGFLAEMLKSAGLGEARDFLGGGAGESQLSSFLVEEYAEATVAAGGIGLSESIYNALVKREIGQ